MSHVVLEKERAVAVQLVSRGLVWLHCRFCSGVFVSCVCLLGLSFVGMAYCTILTFIAARVIALFIVCLD